MAEETGKKLAGAMRKSPTMAGLTRIGPGMYRDKSGKVMGAQGQKLAQITPQQSMAQRGQQAPTNVPGMNQGFNMPGNGAQGLAGVAEMGMNPQGVTPEMGQGQGMGGMYTKPAIISGPGGGEPTRNVMPFPFNPQEPMQRLPGNMPGMSRDQLNNMLAGIARPPIGEDQRGVGGQGNVYGNTPPQQMPMPERRTMPAVGFINRNFMGRQYNR